jgi:ketosteroid isomerase-like protein
MENDMSPLKSSLLALSWLAVVLNISAAQGSSATLKQQVMETERAFAKTMADRDHAAFTSFLSDEAVFFSGDTPLRGKAAVAAAWQPYFEQPEAPFSWEPEIVEVLDSGRLAISSGPVYNASGTRTATFNSVWRLDDSGEWRIVFDKGSKACGD